MTERKEEILRLRAETGASLVSCKKAYDKANEVYMDAKKALLDDLSNGVIPIRPHGLATKFGKAVARIDDINTFASMLSVSCITKDALNSKEFNGLLDILLTISLHNVCDTICDLYSQDLECAYPKVKELGFVSKKFHTVETLLEEVSLILHQELKVEELKHVPRRVGQGEFYKLCAVEHSAGENQIAAVCTFLVPSKVVKNDLDWLKKRVTSAVACYNPIAVHEYSVPESVLEDVKQTAMQEIKTDDPAVKEEVERLAVKQFMELYVLDNIKIVAIPDDGKYAAFESKLPMNTVQEVLLREGISVIDFERISLKVKLDMV